MRKILISLLLVMMPCVAFAGWFSSDADSRISSVSTYHATVGTTTAAAIASASVTGNVYGFLVCNDPVNTSTYLAVGQAADVSTDGVRLGKGKCYVCENCKPAVLKLLKVEGQAASNGYSVIQFKR